MANIDPVHNHDPRVKAQFPRELSIAHVDGIDPRRTALEQTVGKPSGRGAHVRANEVSRVYLECVESAFQFQAAAAHVLERSANDYLGILRHRSTHLADDLTIDLHVAGENEGLGPRSRLGQLSLNQQRIQPLFRHSQKINGTRKKVKSFGHWNPGFQPRVEISSARLTL